MRKLFYLLIAMLVLMSCGNGSKKKNEENKAEEIQPNRIEVLYFHGAQRCITCRAIEANTVALLDSLDFPTLGNPINPTSAIALSSKSTQSSLAL